MSDEKLFEWEQKENQQRFNTSKLVVIIGWIFLMIIGVMILTANIYMAINGIPANETLTNWGGIVLGFLFGSFPSILKEFIADKNSISK